MEHQSEHSMIDCEHKELTLVFAAGAKMPNGGIEKDFVVSCCDCKEDLFRIPARGRNITNLLPWCTEGLIAMKVKCEYCYLCDNLTKDKEYEVIRENGIFLVIKDDKEIIKGYPRSRFYKQ